MRIPLSEYIRNVAITGTGVIIARAIPIAVTPILTRLYSPSDFGVFAAFLALATILTVVASGRYEVAIMMPRSQRRAQVVFLLSLAVSLVSMSILLVATTVVWYLLPSLVPTTFSVVYELGLSIFLVPGFAFLSALSRSLILWNSRRKAFRRVAFSRLTQAATVAIVSISAATYWTADSRGLILGTFAGALSSVLILLPGLRNANTPLASLVKLRLLMREARAYINYPKYSLWADLINALAWRLPMLVFPALFGLAATGQLSIAYRIVGLPSQMIGRAFLDVFRQKASEDFARDGNCLAIYLKTLKILLGLSVLIFIPLILVGADLFSLVFGPEWRISGEIAQILSVMFAAGFVASPLAYILYIANRQPWDLKWQILFAGSTAVALTVGGVTGSVTATVTSLSVLGLICYVIYLSLSYRVASHGVEVRGPMNKPE